MIVAGLEDSGIISRLRIYIRANVAKGTLGAANEFIVIFSMSR